MNHFNTAAAIVFAAFIIAITIFITQPRYQVIEIAQTFNNGFGAWRIDTRSGTMNLCSATPGGLICSNPAIELANQDDSAQQTPVAVEQPAEAPEEK